MLHCGCFCLFYVRRKTVASSRDECSLFQSERVDDVLSTHDRTISLNVYIIHVSTIYTIVRFVLNQDKVSRVTSIHQFAYNLILSKQQGLPSYVVRVENMLQFRRNSDYNVEIHLKYLLILFSYTKCM